MRAEAVHWAGRGLGFGVGVGVVIGVALLAWSAAHVLALVFIAILLASGLEPVIGWLLLGEGARYWFGSDGKTFVQVTAKDWASAQKLLDGYLEGKSTIGGQPTFRDARKPLGWETSPIAEFWNSFHGWFVAIALFVALALTITSFVQYLYRHRMPSSRPASPWPRWWPPS